MTMVHGAVCLVHGSWVKPSSGGVRSNTSFGRVRSSEHSLRARRQGQVRRELQGTAEFN